MTVITKVDLIPLNLTMRQPFVTAHGRKNVSRNLQVAVRLSDGTTGGGEASASLAWPDQNQEAMRRALQQIAPLLIGAEIRRFRSLSADAWQAIWKFHTAAAALECALLDAYTRSRRIPLWKWFGGRSRSVTTSLTISAWPARAAGQAARRAAKQGFCHLKIKLTGKDRDADLERVMAVHRAAPKAALWLDGNQGFTPRQAIGFCGEARKRSLPVELFEQPVPRGEWRSFREIEREGKIPVAADESARSAADARKLIRGRAASVINVKLAKCGISGALETIRLARRANVRLMIGCMAESKMGISPSVALACGSGAFNYVDLDSHLLTVSPPCRAGFSTRGDVLSIRPGNR